MTRNLFRIAATTAFALAVSPVRAAPVVDGTVSTGEYGAPTATVGTSPTAPTSNFTTPGNSATAGYDIFLSDSNDTLFGAVSQTGGTSAGSFANLYFDLDPSTSANGVSEFVIEVNNRVGVIGSYRFNLSPDAVNFASTTLDGLTTTEFSIANSVFRDAIAGVGASGYFGTNGYTAQDIRLNLSQSLSYSVAGGTSYGAEGLGSFSVAAFVSPAPEPATWAMMILGFGIAGGGLRYRRGTKNVSYA
jgi:hypothetical protein